MTDIHTHILPGIDDGAADVTTSKKILEQAKNSGYTNLIFTPHYYCINTAEDFLLNINSSLSSINSVIKDLQINYKIGSEVYISHCPDITNDIKKLAITDTKYILIELSFSQGINKNVFDKLGEVVNYLNLTPIIAHIERYPIILTHPIIAYKLKQQGCVLQLNSSSLFSKRTSKLARALIKHNLIDVISSDVHNDNKRPFTMPQAFSVINQEFGAGVAARLMANADNIFNNNQVQNVKFSPVHKFCKYYF